VVGSLLSGGEESSQNFCIDAGGILNSPTLTPTPLPTLRPSSAPTFLPSPLPSHSHPPTLAPTNSPSFQPTPNPSPEPTVTPTDSPTTKPTPLPSLSPTVFPTMSPTQQCNAGEYLVDGTVCTKCPVGRFRNESMPDSGVVFSNECTQCSPGYYSDVKGNKVCTKCDAGKVSNIDYTDCGEEMTFSFKHFALLPHTYIHIYIYIFAFVGNLQM
jgi:hypothetical protein